MYIIAFFFTHDSETDGEFIVSEWRIYPPISNVIGQIYGYQLFAENDERQKMSCIASGSWKGGRNYCQGIMHVWNLGGTWVLRRFGGT